MNRLGEVFLLRTQIFLVMSIEKLSTIVSIIIVNSFN